MSDTYEYTPEELNKLGEIIVWTTIYAAVHQDGVIHEDERAEAIKQTHIRTFSSEDYLIPIYRHLDTHFEEHFDACAAQVSGSPEEQEEFVKMKIEEATHILPELGPLFAARFTKNVADLFNRVFKADSSIFQIFMLPILTARLNKFGEK